MGHRPPMGSSHEGNDGKPGSNAAGTEAHAIAVGSDGTLPTVNTPEAGSTDRINNELNVRIQDLYARVDVLTRNPPVQITESVKLAQEAKSSTGKVKVEGSVNERKDRGMKTANHQRKLDEEGWEEAGTKKSTGTRKPLRTWKPESFRKNRFEESWQVNHL